MASFKRGFCTHCHGEEKSRIFAVNKDAEVCYCPHCTHAMKPKEAMSNYNWLISFHLKRASKALFESTEYLLAYQTFAHVIDIDDRVKVAYFGRLLSLVYLSTLRTSKISFALYMHRQESKLCHYLGTANEYCNYLWLVLDALDYYESRMLKRLTTHGVFYDTECISLYLERLNEIRQYRKYIVEEAEYFIVAGKDQFKAILDRTRKDDTKYDKLLAQKYVTTEGLTYTFIEYDSNKKPILNIREDLPLQSMHRFKPASLYSKENKKILIPDEIYLNNLPLSRLVAVSVPVAFVLFSLVLAGIIAALAPTSQNFKLAVFILSALLLPASLMLIALHFSWKNRLKKKYYNGTNPFIFK